MLGIVGCSASPSGPEGKSEAFSGEGDPVEPVAAPESWDYEADLVVVGTGGGGLAATNLAAESGLEVIAVEKESRVGGATRHASGFVLFAGGSSAQKKMGAAWPNEEFDALAAVNAISPYYQYSLDVPMYVNMVENGGECIDWILEHDGIQLIATPRAFLDKDIVEGKQNSVLGMNNTVNAMEACALSSGANIMLSTKAQALVMDGDAVVGITATTEDGKQLYIRGEKGVILCGGGMGMNRDLTKQYIPALYEQAMLGGPMPFHTGDPFRMGKGAGADHAGLNSFSCWEGALDEFYGDGDGSYWHYFWNGPRQLLTNPWLFLDERCRRAPYFGGYTFQPEFINGDFCNGEVTNASVWMSLPGHGAYVVLDDNYEENLPKINNPKALDKTRTPIVADGTLIDNNLVTDDWKQEFQEAIERSAVKKADTLEELAEMVGLDKERFVAAVNRWNEVCESGLDTDLAIPYNPDWLIKIEQPPFYCAKIGAMTGKTLCGLRVDEEMRVLKPGGQPIPGLYANFTTAGGIAGENSYGSQWTNTSLLGANALSWTSGYLACKTLIKDSR